MSSSRDVLAAKSAWPPSDAPGTRRPSTLRRSASPRPVPAARTAALPRRDGRPACSDASSSGCSTPTPYASASRSFSTHVRRKPSALPTAAQSMRQGTLVRCATWSVTAPATPKHAASIAVASVPCECRNVADHRLEPGVVEGDEFGDVHGGRTCGPAAKMPSSVFVPPMSPARSMAYYPFNPRLDIRTPFAHLRDQ